MGPSARPEPATNLARAADELAAASDELTAAADNLAGTAGNVAATSDNVIRHGDQSRATTPSRPPDPNATASGTPERVPPKGNEAAQRSIPRQNEAADLLARLGYDVEHRPTLTADDLASGISPDKKPDFRIEGEVFDAYAPSRSRAWNIASQIETKVMEGQTRRVVLELSDSPVGFEEMMGQLSRSPIEGLEEVIIVEDGSMVGHWLPEE